MFLVNVILLVDAKCDCIVLWPIYKRWINVLSVAMLCVHNGNGHPSILCRPVSLESKSFIPHIRDISTKTVWHDCGNGHTGRKIRWPCQEGLKAVRGARGNRPLLGSKSISGRLW